MRALAVEFGVWFEWLATGRGLRDYLPEAQEQAQEYRVQVTLPEDEQSLQAIYRKLSPARREALLDFLKRWG